MQIRKGTKEDLPRVLELIKELAQYEKALNQVTNTVAQLEIDGFGANPVYGFFVATNGSEIIGLSLYYFRYSTWKGKRLYLEDIIVTENFRGRGIGKMLFEKTVQQAIDGNCTGMMWQVLDWNETAINFYKKYNSRIEGDWLNCHLERDQMISIMNNN